MFYAINRTEQKIEGAPFVPEHTFREKCLIGFTSAVARDLFVDKTDTAYAVLRSEISYEDFRTFKTRATMNSHGACHAVLDSGSN